jgi:hypothetical protein
MGKTEPQENDVTSRNLKKKDGDISMGCSGRTALRREQCDGFAQSTKLWSHKTLLLGKHIPNPVNNRISVA